MAMMNWYALYTKPKMEDAVAQKLRQTGIEVYNPKYALSKFFGGRLRTIIESLFPCYLFVRFSPEEHGWMISYTRGVKKILGDRQGPWIVPEDIISWIRSHEKDGITAPRTKDLKTGDTVRITGGPLFGLTGIFMKTVKGSERAMLLLHALDYQAEVVVDRSSLVCVE